MVDMAWYPLLRSPTPLYAVEGQLTPRVAIVGAGAAGLTCAWRLARWGVRVAVFEAAPRLGGTLAERPAAAPLAFPAVAPFLQLLVKRGAVAQHPLLPCALTACSQTSVMPLLRWPLAWWRLWRWGKCFSDRPLAQSPARAIPAFYDWLAAVTDRWLGGTLAERTWPELAPLAPHLLWPRKPFGWQVAEPPSEWFAVALARTIGQRGHAVQVAAAVTALTADTDGWQVTATGLPPWGADAVVLAVPPAVAAQLIPTDVLPLPLPQPLAGWPTSRWWGTPQPRPQPVSRPLAVAPRLWLAGGWIPPEGALPGLDGAVGSGWTTARAVRSALLR